MTDLDFGVQDVGRHPGLLVGYVEHGEGPSLLPSYATYASSVMLSQSPSMNLSLCLIQQSWLIFSPLHNVTASCIAASSERTRVYSYASSSCLEKKSICMCIGKWYLVSPFHRLALTCSEQSRHSEKTHYCQTAPYCKLSAVEQDTVKNVLKCIGIKTKKVGHPYRVFQEAVIFAKDSRAVTVTQVNMSSEVNVAKGLNHSLAM